MRVVQVERRQFSIVDDGDVGAVWYRMPVTYFEVLKIQKYKHRCI